MPVNVIALTPGLTCPVWVRDHPFGIGREEVAPSVVVLMVTPLIVYCIDNPSNGPVGGKIVACCAPTGLTTGVTHPSTKSASARHTSACFK